ncbi:MAG: hypothetical protein H8E12_08935 [Rhodobacteraceae bacterium]|nr:hypothetical protein [Paracoccaceae bacterium]
MKVGDLVKFTIGAASTVNAGVIVNIWTIAHKNRVQSVDILWGDKIITKLVGAIEVINENR